MVLCFVGDRAIMRLHSFIAGWLVKRLENFHDLDQEHESCCLFLHRLCALEQS